MGLEQTLTVTFYGAAVLQIKKATIEGNHSQGVQLIGQVQGLVQDVPTVHELTQRVMQEVHEALASINQLADQGAARDALAPEKISRIA